MKSSRGFVTPVALILGLAVLFFAGPSVYNNQAFFLSTAVFMILALGLNLIYGFTGYLPFGYAVFVGMGAYGFAMGIKFGMPIYLAFLFSIFLSVVLAVVLLPLFRLRSHYFSIATLAAFEAVYYLVGSDYAKSYTGGPYGITLANVYQPGTIYIIAFLSLAFAVFVNAWVRGSRMGLALRAIRDNPLSASMDGVNVPVTRGLDWLLSALIAGLAGTIYGWYISFFYPETVFSLTFSLFVITFVIFGGMGTLVGPVIGVVTLYSLYDVVGISYPYYFDMIFGVLLVLLILFLPGGLSQVVERLIRRKLP